jgi:hypothetical protein
MKSIIITSLAISVLLMGCGGGSDSNEGPDSPPPPPPPPPSNVAPVASFVMVREVDERSTLTLDATGSSDSDGSISSYSWSIDYGDYSGDNITLTGSGSTATIAIGEMVESPEIDVLLTVKDDDGSEHSVTEYLLVREVDAARLPPMPSDPKAGLLGTDSDDDGVRDDLEIAIYNLTPMSVENREVNRFAATVFQNILVAGVSEDDLDDGDASEKLSKLVSCYRNHSSMDSRAMRATIRGLSFDTPERLAAYEKYLAGRNGTVQRVLEATADECKLQQN